MCWVAHEANCTSTLRVSGNCGPDWRSVKAIQGIFTGYFQVKLRMIKNVGTHIPGCPHTILPTVRLQGPRQSYQAKGPFSSDRGVAGKLGVWSDGGGPMLTRVKLGLGWESNLGPWGEPSVVLKQLPELSSLWDYWQAWLVKATLISFRLSGTYWSYYEEFKKEGIPQAPPEFKLWSPSGDYPSLNRGDKRESCPTLWSQF